MSSFAGLLSEYELEKHAKVDLGGLARTLLSLWTGF